MTSSFPYCAKFGFDENTIKRRLAFLYLSENDHALAQRLQREVIAPSVDEIIERFYEMLTYQPESRRILTTGALINQLKKAQSDYLTSLGLGFDTLGYFEERLRIGMAHAWVGLPISVYQCAYRGLIQFIIDAFPASISRDDREAMAAFLLKITTLDMSLAIETYHISQMSNLEDEVARMHDRTDQLRRKAATDSLTGLLNHENAFIYLENAITAAQGASKPLSVMMADLDYFKRVNDSYGHLVGDAVLQEVASRIMASVRDPDVVGRYGGEEFMIILADATLGTAQQIAERLRARIEATPIKVHDELIKMTISIGVTTLQDEDDFRSLVKRADEALYAAKGAGRNRVIVING